MTRVPAAAVAILLAILAAGCSASVSLDTGEVSAAPTSVAATDPTPAPTASADATSDDAGAESEPAPPPPTPEPPPELSMTVARVVNTFGHDTSAFSQGLLFIGDRLYESRGRYGESALTEIDPQTGDVLRRVDLADEFFAEGLAHVDGRLIQLTWQEEVAFVWDAETFEPLGEFTYRGEGWGLCYDGQSLWMSDGSATLTRRNAADFAALEVVDVTLEGQPVVRLNELECIDGFVWANVWLTDTIVVIDPRTGDVVEVIDAAGLLTTAELEAGADVLNGIAYDPARDAVIITGKLWPSMFEIQRDPAG